MNWDDVTVREVWNVPAPAIRKVARVIMGYIGAAIIVVAVLRWVT